MLIFDNGIIKAYARIFPENRKRTRLEIEQTEESLLAEAFPGHKNIAIGHRADGAPLLLNTPFPAAISISHSNRVVALAIADNSKATFHGIGIDTETFDRGSQLRRIAPRFLSPLQRSAIITDRQLLRAWTIKEALYKAAGRPGWPLREIPLPQKKRPRHNHRRVWMHHNRHRDSCRLRSDDPCRHILARINIKTSF